MKKNEKKSFRLNTTQAFTLIEMLIVVAIIGILATIVVVSVNSARKKSYATKAKADMVEITKGFETGAAEGCRTISLTTTTDSAILACAIAGNNTQYVKLQKAPPGIKYTITVGGGTATSDATGTGTGAWSGQSINQPINSQYTFEASGFSGTTTFTCSTSSTSSGCQCSSSDGCITVQ